jgi:hypothetical protein
MSTCQSLGNVLYYIFLTLIQLAILTLIVFAFTVTLRDDCTAQAALIPCSDLNDKLCTPVPSKICRVFEAGRAMYCFVSVRGPRHVPPPETNQHPKTPIWIMAGGVYQVSDLINVWFDQLMLSTFCDV